MNLSFIASCKLTIFTNIYKSIMICKASMSRGFFSELDRVQTRNTLLVIFMLEPRVIFLVIY